MRQVWREPRKSQKEERRAARRKAKEEKEIESVLEISRLEAERSNSASLMLELRPASVSSSAPKLDVLGAVAQSKTGTERRICPFTGAVECDPDIEEKDSNPDSFLYHNMPVPPDAPPCESKNSNGIDEFECAKDTDTDESLDSDLNRLLSEPSIPPADTSMIQTSMLTLFTSFRKHCLLMFKMLNSVFQWTMQPRSCLDISYLTMLIGGTTLNPLLNLIQKHGIITIHWICMNHHGKIQ